MADDSYNARVRMEQDGKRLAAGSSGSIDIESGGDLDIESGGALKLRGTQVNSTGGAWFVNRYARADVETVVGVSTESTAAVSLVNHGLSLISSTGSTGGSATFKLPAPAAGLRKTIIAQSAAAGKTAIVSTTAGAVSINYTKTYHNLTFNADDEAVVLEGVSATKWVVASNVGAVALST